MLQKSNVQQVFVMNKDEYFQGMLRKIKNILEFSFAEMSIFLLQFSPPFPKIVGNDTYKLISYWLKC